MNLKIKKAAQIFWYFFKIGWFTFGGGWSIVAQMQKDFVEKDHSISEAELLDIVSVGRSLPGTMIGNVAYLYGYREAGVLGGIAALCGMSSPAFFILCVITGFYTQFKDNLYVAKALVGVRAVVAPVIISAVAGLMKSAFPKPICWGIAVLAGAGILFLKLSCVWIVVAAALTGILIARVARRKES